MNEKQPKYDHKAQDALDAYDKEYAAWRIRPITASIFILEDVNRITDLCAPVSMVGETISFTRFEFSTGDAAEDCRRQIAMRAALQSSVKEQK